MSKIFIFRPSAPPLFALALLSGLTHFATAVELHNWRAPFYQIAAEMGLVTSSPSGMFWDDLRGPVPLFDSTFWQGGKTDAGANRWIFEPAVSIGLKTPRATGEKLAYGEIEALSEIRYRNLLVRQTLHADKLYEYDPLFPAHPDRIARGRIEEAYVRAEWQYGFLRLGRMLRNWGPFVDRSLFLSSNPYSYDALEWGVHSSLFEFRHLFAAFAQNPHSQFSDNMAGRFFTAHSLNVMIRQWVTAGIFETMVFRRTNGFPDLQYVNPFSLYTVLNTNQEGNGNLMLGIQASLHPGTENISIRGQAVLDDFQVDNELVTDREPPHWGMDAGLYWRDPLLRLPFRHLLKTGYQRRSEWIYTVSDNDMDWGEGYTYLSKSLGFPENDGDNVWLGASIIGKKTWLATALFSYGREGEKTPTSRWHDQDAGNIPGLPYDYKLAAFPSGTVESTVSFTLEGAAYVRDYADLRIGVVNRWIKNRDHVLTSGPVYSPLFTAVLGLHFSDLCISLPK